MQQAGLVGVTVALAVYASRQLGGSGDHYTAGGRLKGWLIRRRAFARENGAAAPPGAHVGALGGEDKRLVRSADGARAGY